ncbi:hypothetical protein DCAR_0314142 [Daucus carota subsp. sativus]|uniref:Phytocyanin domain-containing protein n=1 Tax=Daucus carota subsp. sativus TaxID=79200 RepID=A0AAF1AWI4_DAUCS|nr:PREDICTED: mavicyanin-like [Daucus carota subsp. sativus]WOG94845.1 hypothetical protein DCAR_0314142 [Daucus carota subsp. sativus]
MGFAMRLMVVLVLFSALTSSLIKGEVYKVGDSAGWTSVMDVDYKHWAETKTFHVGDTIIFKYNKEFHNVLQVSYENYKSCNATNPIAIFTTGNDSITIKSPAHFFYICGYPQHCQAGQKVDIRVPRSVAPGPAPGPSLPPTSAPRIPPVPGNGTGSSSLNTKCCFYTIVLALLAIFAY